MGIVKSDIIPFCACLLLAYLYLSMSRYISLLVYRRFLEMLPCACKLSPYARNRSKDPRPENITGRANPSLRGRIRKRGTNYIISSLWEKGQAKESLLKEPMRNATTITRRQL